jgi:hypothetical protein
MGKLIRDNVALTVFGVIIIAITIAFVSHALGGPGLNYYEYGMLLGGLLVLGIMSFLLRENSFYRLLEHAVVGMALGIGAYRMWDSNLRPSWWWKTWDGITGAERWYWLYLLVPVVSLLWYFMYSKKYLWLNRVILGLFMGVAAGYIVQRELAKQIGQLRAMGRPLYSADLFGFEVFTNIVMWLLVLIVMYYFFFTFKREGPVQDTLSRWGRLAMMIGFGALFGNTVQGRLAWLIDRFVFMVQDVFRGVILQWFA